MGGKDKWGVLAVLLVLGYFGYQKFFKPSPVEPVYEQWSMAVAARNCATLESMAEGKAKDWAEDFCSQTPDGSESSQEVQDQSADVDLHASAKEKALDVVRDVLSQTTNPDGTITLVAKETHLPIPGTLQKPAPPQRVTLTLKKEKGGWKVVDYSAKDL